MYKNVISLIGKLGKFMIYPTLFIVDSFQVIKTDMGTI